ncbi:carbon-nitrogen hydrolase [Xylariaceae sp. FL1272]|nr:carbon-nitrogen hydrolase [Xylariaceae sp. FL1272]
MRIGCLQFAPEVADRNNNLNRADAILSKANPQNLDLLVLPELAFTGYNFKSLYHINPCLELKGSGISALWARSVALRFNCVVTVGYPEKVDVKLRWPTSPEYYNSVIVVNPDGETIGNYRKSFLYYTDQTWALEGPDGFYGGSIPGLGQTAMGICMDINPYRFEAPWNAFEFAFHCLQVEANLVILTMAWLTREDAHLFTSMPHEPDMDTLTYWLTRLEPIIRSECEDEIIVVFCNRTGVEDDAVYAGTSTVLGIKDGEVSVYGILGRGESELLVVDTDAEPYAKLVYGSTNPNSAIASAVGSVQEPGNSNWHEAHAIEDENPSTSPPPCNVDSAEEFSEHAIDSQTQSTGLGQLGQAKSFTSQTPHSSQDSQYDIKSDFTETPSGAQVTAYNPRRAPHDSAPRLDVGEDFSYVPLGLGSTAASDSSIASVQGSISSHGSSTLQRLGSLSSLKTSGYDEPRPPSAVDDSSHIDQALPTPTAPSPTPLDVRPDVFSPRSLSRQANSPRQSITASKKPPVMPDRLCSPRSRNTNRSGSTNVAARGKSSGPLREENLSRNSERDHNPYAGSPGKTTARDRATQSRQDSGISSVEYATEAKSRHSLSHANPGASCNVLPGAESHQTHRERVEVNAVSHQNQRVSADIGIGSGESQYNFPRSDLRVSALNGIAHEFECRSPAEFEAEIRRISPDWSVKAFYGDSGNGDPDEIIGEIVVHHTHRETREPSSLKHSSSKKCLAPKPKAKNVMGSANTGDEEVGVFEGMLRRPNFRVDSVPWSPADSAESAPGNCAHSDASVESLKDSPMTADTILSPQTPKAMVLIPNGNDSLPVTPLTAPFIKPLQVAKYTVKGAVDNVSTRRPKSAVW